MTPKPISLDATSFLKLTTLPVPPHIQLLNGHFLSDSTNSNGILHLPLQTCCLRDFSSFSPSLGIKTLASPLMSVSLSLHLPCPGYWSIKYTCSGVIILRPMDWNRQDIYLVHSCHCYALDCTLYCRNFFKISTPVCPGTCGNPSWSHSSFRYSLSTSNKHSNTKRMDIWSSLVM